jgi:HEAT repeat protein
LSGKGKGLELEGRGQEKLPLDARLLSEAVIELNISRRNVALYPPEHAIIRDSMERAFGLLQRLFEIRESITLGVAKDALVIDEYTLDRKNAVFRELATSLHSKGIAAVTFSAGLTREELLGFHEIMAMSESPAGGTVADCASEKGISHIRLDLIDFSGFKFVEGALRPGVKGDAIWEDYVYGLMEGRLAAGDAEAVVLGAPSDRVADLVNSSVSETTGDDVYDRVIAAYLGRKGKTRLNRESFEKFASFMDNLSPALKRQFLSRTFSSRLVDVGEVENLLADMSSNDFQKMAEFFASHSSLVPEALGNIIDKLASVNKSKKFGFDLLLGNKAVVDDIEIDEDVMQLFFEDNFWSFVNDKYRGELSAMLSAPAEAAGAEAAAVEGLASECSDEAIDRAASEVLVEALETGSQTEEFRRSLAYRLTEFAVGFVETGRFREALDIHNALSSEAAPEVALDFFHSAEFMSQLMEALKLWGRKSREAAVTLALALKPHVIRPMLEALSQEGSAGTRRYLLSLLGEMGDEVVGEALKMLEDGPWYVQRNMLYLIRTTGGEKHLAHARKFAKHENAKVRMEAVMTLLDFGAPEAASHIISYLQGQDAEARDWAIRQAGNHRVAQAVPHLISLLEKKDLLGTESHLKTPVVVALGKIGDPRALVPLLKICNARTLLYKGYLEELKVEIYKSLDNYPAEARRPLVEAGLKSRNDEIRAISRRLSGRPPGRGN